MLADVKRRAGVSDAKGALADQMSQLWQFLLSELVMVDKIPQPEI